MAENTSPEEKLFKIIQQEKRPSLKGEDPAQKKNRKGWIGGLKRAILSWEERLLSKIRGFGKKTKSAPNRKIDEIQLFAVNAALLIILLLLVLFTVYYTVTRYPNIAKIVNATVRAQSSLPSVNKDALELQPLNYYTEDARQRDIFNAVQAAVVTGAETVSLNGEKNSGGGDLKLQGIARSDAPKAMIYSEKDNKLYILKEGQAVGTTGVRVKEILNSKVILSSGDKEFEI